MTKYAIQNQHHHFLLPGFSGFSMDSSQALLFDNQADAGRIIKCNLRKEWQSGCKVVALTLNSEDNNVVKEDVKVNNATVFTNLSLQETTTHEGLILLHKQIKALSKTLSSMATKKDYYAEQQSHYDLLLSDLYHEVELSSLDEEEGVELLRKMQDILKKRRQIKDMHDFACIISDGDFRSLQRLGNRLNSLDSRTYEPRIK